MNCVFADNFIPPKIDMKKFFSSVTEKGFANIMHNEKNSKEELTTLSLGFVCTSFLFVFFFYYVKKYMRQRIFERMAF